MTPNGSDDRDDADDGNGLDALDFDTPVFDDDVSGLDALPDYEAGQSKAHDSGLDSIHDYTSHEVEEDEDDDFGAIDTETSVEDEEQIPVVQAVNPPGTVAVTAYLNGSVAQVDLDPKVTTLTEAQLADEIRVVAGVAAKRATAVVHIGVVNMLVEQGMDFREARDFVETNMPFATPEQAGEAELALIARHSDQSH
ncbi:YbaB/EbfC family DNA-binding protein [Mycolicibacterium septicum]|nr:YbaB/EbfC family DNA-binding protein [Mycolicibacterium septicum]